MVVTTSSEASVASQLVNGVATLAADPALTILKANDAFYAITGETPASYQKQKHSLRHFLDEGIGAQVHKLLEQDRPASYSQEMRLFRNDGTPTLINVTTVLIEGQLYEERYPVYHVVISDITELKASWRRAEFERKKYNIISDASKDILFEYDFVTDTMVYADRYREVFGRPSVVSAFRQKLESGKGEHGDIGMYFRSLLAETASLRNSEIPECQAVLADGSLCWFSIFCSTLQDDQGNPIKAVGALRDIDRQKREQLKLLDKSRMDAMTGLYNKATVEEEIRKALGAISSRSYQILMMIDIDNFKIVNDTMGHLAGDSVLVELARQLKRTFRKEDLIGRIGGDEFHVFMSNVADPSIAREKARILCSSIQSLFRKGDVGSDVSVSIGIAVIQEPLPYDELFRQADIALYHAKSNGKNRYEVYGETDVALPQQGQASSPFVVARSRNSIMVDIVDILFSMYDMQEGIEKALSFIGNAFSVDQIAIFEKSLNLKTISLVHAWTASTARNTLEHFHDVPMDSLNLPTPTDSSGILYCSDVSTLPAEKRKFLEQASITSLLQCSIMRDGQEVGLIGFEEHSNRRIWTQQEVDTLILMSKLVGEYIRQKQSRHLLENTQEVTRAILNSLPTVCVYVVRRDDRRIVYFNDTLHRKIPNAQIGMTCYETFWFLPERCAFCPLEQGDGLQCISTVLENTPFGKMVDISFSPILWENQEPAYVALVSEHKQMEQEREQQRKKVAFSRAICSIYDYVVDLVPDTGQYEILAIREATLEDIPSRGEYMASLRIAAAHCLAPYQEHFLNMFALDTMLEAFANGLPGIQMEYQKQEKGVCRWKSRYAYPFHQDNEPLHILIYIRDITDQKEDTVRKEHEKEEYRLALQSSYVEIYRLDVETDKVSLVSRKSDLLAGSNLEEVNQGVTVRAENWIHPDDRAAYTAFYDRAALRERLQQGQRPSEEYRRLGKDGRYHWVAALVIPMPGNACRALFLLKDIDDRKGMEEINKRMEMQHTMLFRHLYESVIEINLDTCSYSRVSFKTDIPFHPSNNGDYEELFQRTLLLLVHPEDVQKVRDAFSPDALRKARTSGDTEKLVQYRVVTAQGHETWLESRLFLMQGEAADTAFILVRNINREKAVEEEWKREEQRFTVALRNTYSQIYDLDLETGTPILLYNNRELMLPPLQETNADLFTVASLLVHPDDQHAFMDRFNVDRLRSYFEQGHEDFTDEYRHRAIDGTYHWVSAVVMPLPADSDQAGKKVMVFVRDISERKLQEHNQRLAEQYDRALRNIYDELYELNVTQNTYRIVYHVENKYVSPPEEGILNEAIAEVSRKMIFPDDRNRFLAFFNLESIRKHFASGRETLIGEFRKLWKDGLYHWASLTMFPISNADNGDETYLVFIMDIGVKKQTEEIAQHNLLLEQQRLDDERYRTIVEQTGTLVFEWNESTGQRYTSPEIPRKFAGTYDGRDIIQVWREDGVIHPNELPLLQRFLENIREGKEHAEITAQFLTHSGRYIWCKVALSSRKDAHGGRRLIGTLNDVDDATRSVLALKYRAEYDTLTGVYNMQTFYTKTEALLREHPERQYSIIRMDIDRFKVINDLYGLHEGDRLLRRIARLLAERLTTDQAYGRIGGDIFCICVDFTEEETIRYVEEITDKLAAYPLPYKIVPSFGICKVDNELTPINILCDWANLALKTIKGNYLKRYAFYDEKLREKILVEKKIESEMHEALIDGQFTMYLQPKVHIATARIIGSEALVRWIHPTEGLVPPDRFVPLFEKNGFIVRLDEYIWEQACKSLRKWLDQGHTPSPISINVSRVHFHDSRLSEKLLGLIRKYDIPPQLLELELTETAFLENEKGLSEAMRNLQQHGFLFSMDDFGSGYSSLNMLKSLPINIVKIDREFLNEGVSTNHGQIIIRHTIAMARQMDMRVIAEGVETLDQAAFLLQSGCIYAQGYYYSRPVPLDTFEALAFGESQPFLLAPELTAIAPEPLQG